jgi:hypothetical protein
MFESMMGFMSYYLGYLNARFNVNHLCVIQATNYR